MACTSGFGTCNCFFKPPDPPPDDDDGNWGDPPGEPGKYKVEVIFDWGSASLGPNGWTIARPFMFNMTASNPALRTAERWPWSPNFGANAQPDLYVAPQVGPVILVGQRADYRMFYSGPRQYRIVDGVGALPLAFNARLVYPGTGVFPLTGVYASDAAHVGFSRVATGEQVIGVGFGILINGNDAKGKTGLRITFDYP